MSNYGVVRVGAKPESDYISAVLFCLDRSGEVKVQGLGKRQGKVLDIAVSVSKINGVKIREINGIRVEDTRGLEVLIKLARSGENE